MRRELRNVLELEEYDSMLKEIERKIDLKSKLGQTVEKYLRHVLDGKQALDKEVLSQLMIAEGRPARMIND